MLAQTNVYKSNNEINSNNSHASNSNDNSSRNHTDNNANNNDTTESVILNNGDWKNVCTNSNLMMSLFHSKCTFMQTYNGYTLQLYFEDDIETQQRRLCCPTFSAVAYCSMNDNRKSSILWQPCVNDQDAKEQDYSMEQKWAACLSSNNIFNAWSKFGDDEKLQFINKSEETAKALEIAKQNDTRFCKLIFAMTGGWFPLGYGSSWMLDDCAVAKLHIGADYVSFCPLSDAQRNDTTKCDDLKKRYICTRDNEQKGFKKLLLFDIECPDDIKQQWIRFVDTYGEQFRRWQQQWQLYLHLTTLDLQVWCDVPPQYRQEEV